MRKWINKSYKNRLYSAFIIIWLVPFVFLTFFDYLYVYQSTSRNIEQYTKSNLKIAAQLIDSDLQTFSGIVNSIALNEEVAQIVEKDTLLSRNNFDETQRLYSVVHTSMAGLPNSVPIHVVNQHQQSRYSTTNYFLPYYVDERGNLYDTMEEDAASGRVSQQIHWRIDGEDSQDICYVLGRTIPSAVTGDTAGYVILDIFDSYYQDIFQRIASKNGSNIIVTDSKGTIITDMNKQYYTGYKFDSNQNINITDREGVFDLMIENIEYQVYFESSDVSHFKVIELIPKSYFIQSTFSNIQTHLLIFAVVFILGAVMIHRNVRAMVNPITQLDKAMNQVEQGDYSARVSLAGEDEIARLGQSFNDMAMRTQQLIRDNYEKQLALHKAEVKALKAQVNPHFLYNCLNSIQMMAVVGKNEEVMKMTKALSKYYRYRVNTEDELIPLSEELEQIENYLEIQKIRYQDKLTVTIETDEAVKDWKILKLLLQPLVENAIIHGIEQKLGKGRILIQAFSINGGIRIRVMDDGNGFGTSKSGGEKTGLSNTELRLQYYYGSRYQLSVGREEEYTVVQIEIQED